ncbi:hypothetical protein SHKM778_09040 [Streptomyces sp. KM77-8]|uniref:Peptidase M24 domain-containing protein n=1 Tax=Streptomyces haneummycinicus TaxID=3074435 RepID=A0AAT9HBB2_9ACTN
MWAGIAAMKLGNRLVDISRAVETYIRRQPKPGGGKYGIVEDYGGHGIGTEMHMDPHLLNYVERKRGKGPKLVPGFCLAIEPMVSLGTPKTEVLSDDWTVITTDGTWSSHWEHSVALTDQGPWSSPPPTAARRSSRSWASRRRPTRWPDIRPAAGPSAGGRQGSGRRQGKLAEPGITAAPDPPA